MRNFNFKPLVNVRTQKDEFSDKMIATSVVGNFRIPPKVATLLDVSDFDTVSLFSDTDEETKQVYVFIAKGHKGTIALNADGSHVTTETRGTVVYEENDPADGSLVRETTADSKMLSCTSAGAWKALGGSKTKELELSVTSIGEMEYPLPSGTMVSGEVFELAVVNTREIVKRKRTNKDGLEEEETDEATDEAIDDANFVEQEV